MDARIQHEKFIRQVRDALNENALSGGEDWVNRRAQMCGTCESVLILVEGLRKSRQFLGCAVRAGEKQESNHHDEGYSFDQKRIDREFFCSGETREQSAESEAEHCQG